MGQRSGWYFSSSLRVPSLVLLLVSLSFAGSGDPAPFLGVSLSVASPTVPPGGILQMQVFVTEPNPILKGRQGARFSTFAAAAATPLGTIRDAALFSPSGDVSGVAVGKTGGTQVFFSSPLTSFGMTLDTPVMTIAAPVSKGATAGQTVSLTLDPSSSLWYDPAGKLYPVELKSGVMTVGGTLSISDVTPGAGVVQPGTVISVKGIGFDSATTVDVNEGGTSTSQYISPTLMHVTLSLPVDIRGKRVRVTNGSNEKAEYYPYQRTTRLGNSTHALIASSIPLFAQTTWKVGYFRPTLQGTVFSGLALQNLNSVKANVILRLFSKTGVLLSTQQLVLGINTSMARDLAELFPGVVPATGTRLKATSDQPIQMLGLLGDDSSSTLLPVTPTATP